jgi:hypothetical protein
VGFRFLTSASTGPPSKTTDRPFKRTVCTSPGCQEASGLLPHGVSVSLRIGGEGQASTSGLASWHPTPGSRQGARQSPIPPRCSPSHQEPRSCLVAGNDGEPAKERKSKHPSLSVAANREHPLTGRQTDDRVNQPPSQRPQALSSDGFLLIAPSSSCCCFFFFRWRTAQSDLFRQENTLGQGAIEVDSLVVSASGTGDIPSPFPPTQPSQVPHRPPLHLE